VFLCFFFPDCFWIGLAFAFASGVSTVDGRRVIYLSAFAFCLMNY